MNKTLKELKNRKMKTNEIQIFVKSKIDDLYNQEMSQTDVKNVLQMVLEDCIGNNKKPSCNQLVSILKQCYKLYKKL